MWFARFMFFILGAAFYFASAAHAENGPTKEEVDLTTHAFIQFLRRVVIDDGQLDNMVEMRIYDMGAHLLGDTKDSLSDFAMESRDKWLKDYLATGWPHYSLENYKPGQSVISLIGKFAQEEPEHQWERAEMAFDTLVTHPLLGDILTAELLVYSHGRIERSRQAFLEMYRASFSEQEANRRHNEMMTFLQQSEATNRQLARDLAANLSVDVGEDTQFSACILAVALTGGAIIFSHVLF